MKEGDTRPVSFAMGSPASGTHVGSWRVCMKILEAERKKQICGEVAPPLSAHSEKALQVSALAILESISND